MPGPICIDLPERDSTDRAFRNYPYASPDLTSLDPSIHLIFNILCQEKGQTQLIGRQTAF